MRWFSAPLPAAGGDDGEVGLRYFNAELGVRDLEAHEAELIDWRLALPVRKTPVYPEQRHYECRYYCATTDSLLRCDSRLEADIAALLDFSKDVYWVVSQPLRIYFRSEKLEHVPDFCALRSGASPLLIDVSPAETVNEPDRARKFALTMRFATATGWDYGVATEPNEILIENVRLVSRYRRPPADLHDHRPLLLDACASPRTFGELRALTRSPIAVVPSLYHLLWRHELETRFEQPWELGTHVWRPDER